MSTLAANGFGLPAGAYTRLEEGLILKGLDPSSWPVWRRGFLPRNLWKAGLTVAAAILLTSRGTAEAPHLPQLGSRVAAAQSVPCGPLPAGTVTWNAASYILPISPGNDPFPDHANPPCAGGVVVGPSTTLIIDAGGGPIQIFSSGAGLNVAGGTLETANTDANHTVSFQAAADVASWDGINITASANSKGNASLSYISIQGALRSIQISSGATSSPADSHYGLTVSNSGIGFSYFDGIDAIDTPISVTGLDDGKTGTINNIGSIAISTSFDSGAPAIPADALHVDGMTFGSSAPFGVSACPSNQPCYIGNQAILGSFVPHAHQPVSITRSNFYRAGTYGVQLESANLPVLTNDVFVCNGLGAPTTGTPCSGSGPVYSAIYLNNVTADLTDDFTNDQGNGNGLDAIVFNGAVSGPTPGTAQNPTLAWRNATNDATNRHSLGYLLNGDLNMTNAYLSIPDGSVVKTLGGTINLTHSTLDARGSSLKTFTSLRDPIGIPSCPSVFAASCGPAVLPAGEWGGINLSGGSDASFDHANIYYATTGVRIVNGATSTAGAANFGLSVSNSTIGPSFSDGIYASATPISVANTNFQCVALNCVAPAAGDHGISADFTASAPLGGGLRLTGGNSFHGSVNEAIKGIGLAGQTVDIEDNTIDKAGAAGIQLLGADRLTLTNNAVSHSGTRSPTNPAIYLNGVSNADFNTAIAGNTGSGNGLDAIAFHGATATSLKWQTIANSSSSGPLGYMLDGPLAVHGSMTLQTNDYLPSSGPITVTGGTFTATGAVLTSLKDSTLTIPTCGSVFNAKVSNACVRPTPGDWGGLALDSRFSNSLYGASEIRYATTGITIGAPVKFGSASPLTLDASNIRNTLSDGIATQSSLSVRGGSFANIGGHAISVDLRGVSAGANLSVANASISATRKEGILATGLTGQLARIDSTSIDHAGATGISLDGNTSGIDKLTLTRNTVSNTASGFPAVYLNNVNQSFADIHDNNGASNGLNAIAFHGTVAQDLTWVTARKSGAVKPLGYVLDGNLDLAGTLTVKAGDIVKTSGAFNIGRLKADDSGNASPKIFTSLADDTAGVQACQSVLLPGCTGPAAGDWGGLNLGSDGVIVNGAIRYAATGINISSAAGSTFGSSSFGLTVSRSRFDLTKGDAISTIGTPVSLTDSSISNAVHGVSADFPGTGTHTALRLSGNRFAGTSAEAVYGQSLAGHPVWISDNRVQGAATFGIRLAGADSLVLRNNNVTGSASGYPAIYLSGVTADFSRDVRGNVGSANGLDAIVMDGTAIGNVNWISPSNKASMHALGYLLDGGLTLNGGTLTVRPGDTVKALGGAIKINGGTLNAEGAIFTSLKDGSGTAVSCPSVFAATCSPSPGNWGGLVITEDKTGNQGTGTITGGQINFAETAVSADSGPIAGPNPTITLSGVTIANTQKDAINSFDTPITVKDHTTISTAGSHGIIASFFSPANCPTGACERLTIADSEISDTGKDGIVGNGLANQPVTIMRTSVANAGSYGIRLVGADILTMTDNSINKSGTTAPMQPAIYLSAVKADFESASPTPTPGGTPPQIVAGNHGIGNALNAIVMHGEATAPLTWLTTGIPAAHALTDHFGYMLDGDLTVDGDLATNGDVVRVLGGAIKINGALSSIDTTFTSMKDDAVSTFACSTVLAQCAGGPGNSDWNGVSLNPAVISHVSGGTLRYSKTGFTIGSGRLEVVGTTITNVKSYAVHTMGGGSASISCTGIHGNGGGLLSEGASTTSIDNSDLYGNSSAGQDLTATVPTSTTRVWWGQNPPDPSHYTPLNVAVDQPLPQQPPTTDTSKAAWASLATASDNTNVNADVSTVPASPIYGKGSIKVTLKFDRRMDPSSPLSVSFLGPGETPSSSNPLLPHAVLATLGWVDDFTWVGAATVDLTTNTPGRNTLTVTQAASCMPDGHNQMAAETATFNLDFSKATVAGIAGASHVGAAHATLNDNVTANGWSLPVSNPPAGLRTDTFAFFQLRPDSDPAWGPIVIPANPATLLGFQSLGDGITGSPVQLTVGGLLPSTLYDYRAVAVDLNGVTEGATQQFTTTGLASALLLAGNPSTTAGDQYNFTVTAQDAGGKAVRDYTGKVHFDLQQADTGASALPDYTFKAFSSATPMDPGDDGTAAFQQTLTKATNQTILANDTATATLNANLAVKVNPAAASKLVMGQQPAKAVAGVAIAPAVKILVEDQYGNVETDDVGTEHPVTADLTGGSSSATLDGGKGRPDAGGVATFDDLSIKMAGTGYALHGTATGLTSVNSSSFDITPDAVHHLVLTPSSTTITSGGSQAYSAEGFDQYGNSRGDASLSTGFAIAPDGNCTNATSTIAASCTATIADSGGSHHTVTGTVSTKTGTAELTVNAAVPGSPTAVSATAGAGQVTVSWTAPADNGGSPITKYTVTSSPDGKTAVTSDGSTVTAIVTGLTNGTAYTFTVVATNVAGDSLASAPSGAVTPSTSPGAPTGATASAGNGEATVTWAAPPDNGGSPVSSYTVTASPGGAAATTADGTTLTATVTGLANGAAYTFTVVATNASGTGPASAPSAAVTPRTTPGAPTGAAASPGSSQATVTWTAPADNGGSPISSYTVTASPGGAAATTADGTTLTATVTGLIDGTTYTFTVVATNVAGNSSASVPAEAITAGAPVAPGSVSAVSGSTGEATVTWTVPADNGTPIDHYNVTPFKSGVAQTPVDVPGAASTTITFTGLTADPAYTFRVTATSSAGTSPAGTSAPVAVS